MKHCSFSERSISSTSKILVVIVALLHLIFVLSSRLKAEEEQQKKDDDKARRDYIKNEYLRRKQLKLMDDMDEVIKPRSGSLKKKPRPKSIHRDVMESSTPPVRATGGRHTDHTQKRQTSLYDCSH